ncbi:hypothetical protein BJ741DRAFT_577683 [Chytriomyces cf. hyalinus JEL632]|nr:hypothetical protein BJ741DRAFT_577683 [Chytriomyces cf. hyalinus JEL632]
MEQALDGKKCTGSFKQVTWNTIAFKFNCCFKVLVGYKQLKSKVQMLMAQLQLSKGLLSKGPTSTTELAGSLDNDKDKDNDNNDEDKNDNNNNNDDNDNLDMDIEPPKCSTTFIQNCFQVPII